MKNIGFTVTMLNVQLNVELFSRVAIGWQCPSAINSSLTPTRAKATMLSNAVNYDHSHLVRAMPSLKMQ